MSKTQKAAIQKIATETCCFFPMSKKAFIKRLAARGLVYWMEQYGELRVSISGEGFDLAREITFGK